MSAGGIAVVVLSYGAGKELDGLLETLFSESVPPPRILIVHNPSVPNQSAPEVPEGCALVQAPYNLGYAAGMNLGIERQLRREPEFLLLVTHDARLRTGALAALLDAARVHPDYGVLGPVLVVGGTDEPFSFGGMTRQNGSVTHVRQRPPSAAGAVVSRDWIDGGTMLIRADALARVGGFDERFWGYGEEADLCLRTLRAGYGVGVVVGAVAEQAPGGTKRLGAWSYLITRNGIEYARRARGLSAALSLTLRSLQHAIVGLLRAGARSTRLRSGDPGVPWAESVGAIRGSLDFFRRRWGPPPALPGMGDVSNTRSPRAAAPPRVLHLGPDIATGGGMAAALRALMSSPLADLYRLEAVPTYRDGRPLPRLAVYCASLLRLMAWRLGRRGRIVHVHATVRGSMYRKAVCVLAAKSLGARVVLHVHSGPGDIEAFAGRLGRPSRTLFAFAMRASDRSLAVSAASAAAMQAAFGGDGLMVVPNAAPRIAPARRREGGLTVTRALYLGGFANRAKGGDVLLDALPDAISAAPELRVTLAGPGELPDAGRALAGPGTAVNWLGWLDERGKSNALEGSDVFILASRSEGLPMALLEAMASGLAIVATAVGGVPEVLESERDALLVAPEDPAQLAASLTRLAGDPALRSRLGIAARERARELDATFVTARLDAIYSALL